VSHQTSAPSAATQHSSLPSPGAQQEPAAPAAEARKRTPLPAGLMGQQRATSYALATSGVRYEGYAPASATPLPEPSPHTAVVHATAAPQTGHPLQGVLGGGIALAGLVLAGWELRRR
jgi:hypothetical protein